MKFNKVCLLIMMCSLVLLSSCYGQLYVLVLPEKEKGEYYAGKVSFGDWSRRGGIIKLFDESGTPIICEAKYTTRVTSSTCSGSVYSLDLNCSNERTIEFYLISRDCTESYGTAVDDMGNIYRVYIGIYDDILKIQKQKCSS